ncbi:MAG: glycerol-3-phosphate 1-O-acyltransferase PlsY [Pseudomonadota bacterium]
MPQPLGGFDYTWPFYLGALLGYLVGAIPFGLLLTRAAGLGDIRQIGSGNIGATNVLRTGNKALAAATLLLDGGKGAAAVLIAGHWGPDMALFAGGGALLGHLYPVWLKFKGGKGVATGLGILLALDWRVGGLACLTWLAMAFLFRYSSLSALAAFLFAPVYAWFVATRTLAEFALFLALLVWWRHRENIRRLLVGQEPKIGAKKS